MLRQRRYRSGRRPTLLLLLREDVKRREYWNIRGLGLILKVELPFHRDTPLIA